MRCAATNVLLFAISLAGFGAGFGAGVMPDGTTRFSIDGKPIYHFM